MSTAQALLLIVHRLTMIVKLLRWQGHMTMQAQQAANYTGAVEPPLADFEK